MPAAPRRTLADLPEGQSATIARLEDKGLALKLMEMGVLPECYVEMRHKAPFGDPLCIHVCGYTLSMRRSEAQTVILH